MDYDKLASQFGGTAAPVGKPGQEDYDALASQFGGTAAPTEEKQEDFDALAKKFGGDLLSVAPAAASAPSTDTEFLDPEAALLSGVPTPAAPTLAAPKKQLAPPGSTWDEIKKGFGSAWEGVKMLPDMLGLQTNAEVVDMRQQLLNAYDQIDQGKKFTPAEASNLKLDYAMLRNYEKADADKRSEIKGFDAKTITERKEAIKEAIPAFAEYQKRIEPYKGRVPDATDIQSFKDFQDWLGFNVAAGTVQLLPVMAAAYTTGGSGAFMVGTGFAMQEGVQNRLEFILDKVKSLPPEEQAQAVQDYLKATGDTTTLVALASGALDLAGPVGTILRKQLSKEAGKEVVKYATKREAAKAAAKEAPRELLEEGLTGGAQEATQIAGEQYIGEQTGDVFSEANVKRVFNAAAAEAAGSLGGSGVNIGTAVGQQALQDRAEKQAAVELKRQLDDRLRKANAEQLGPVFDSLVAQVKAEKPGISEIDAFKEAGKRLATSGGVDRGTVGTETGGGEPSVSVPSGEGAVTQPAAAPTKPEVPSVAVPSAPVSDVGGGTESVVGAVEPITKETIRSKYVPYAATDILNRAYVIQQEGKEQGATISDEVALRQAETEVTEDVDPASIIADPNKRYVLTPEEKTQFTTLNTELNAAQTAQEEATQALNDAVGFDVTSYGVERLRSDFKFALEDEQEGKVSPNPFAFENVVLRPNIRPLIENFLGAVDTVDSLQNQLTPLQNIIIDGVPKEAAPTTTETTAETTTTPAETVTLDQVTSDTPASQLPTNPDTGLKPKGKRGGRKPVTRTPEEQAAAEAQRKERQKVGKDSIRAMEKARRVIEKPFDPNDYETMDAAKAAALELQQERYAALAEAFRILADRNISPTAKAKQTAKAIIEHPSVDPDEKRRAQQRAQPTETARMDMIADSTNSQPDTFYETVTDASKAIEHVIKTGNPFEKLLAQRIKEFLKGVKVVVVNDPDTDIPDAKTRKNFRGAMGLYVEKGKDRTIYLSNLPGLKGINNMTFLHEALHGATIKQISSWIKDPNSVSPEARAAIADMQNVMLQAYKYYAIMNVKGRTDPLEDALFKLGAFTDLKEFVAYGMTQPEMQDFLMKVPGRYVFDSKTLNRGLLTKFVQSIRKMFRMGPQYDSAFQDLVVVTDQLLSASGPQPSSGTIIAAAKKVKAQNKTLAKIFRSTNATEVNKSIGELMMETRDAKGAIRLLKSTFDALTVGSIRKILPTMTTDDITRWVGDRINNLTLVNDAVQNMAGMRAQMIRELAERVPQWIEFGRKYEKGAQVLGDVMHAATLLGVDPTQYKDLTSALNNDVQLQQLKTAYQAALNDPAKTPRQRTAAKGAVTKRENEIKSVYQGGTVINPDTNEKYTIEGWEQLGKYGNGEGHQIFSMARQAYKETFDLHQQLLIEKITKANIPGQANNPKTPKGKLIAQITQTFQEAQKLGLYFPLMRYGNYWLRIGKGKAGEFYMFESATARNNYARKRAEEAGKGYDEMLADQTFEVGDDISQIRSDVVESSKMLKDIFKALEDGAVVDPTTGKAGISDVDAIKDQVYQMYLMTLPDRDIRRKFTHRQGKTGFSADVLRNFIVSQHTAANQLARLKYSDDIRLAIGASYAELAGNPDTLKLSAFVDEIAMRATSEMTPAVPGEFDWDKLANVGNQAVFFYMLTSPKSALVQMTQLPLVGLPVLVARYGATETAKVTARYTYFFNKFGTTKRDAAGNVVTKWGEPSINDSSYVNKHPDANYRKALKRAWEVAQDRDLFMSTYASDMTSRARVPTASYKGVLRRGTRATMDFMSGAFHHLERITRETMYMSSFELEFARAKKEGFNDSDATDRAINVATKLVYEALFNYSQYNKPRIMKANVATKLGTQFMTYPLQITSYLVRNFYGMLPFLNKTEKRDAAIKFFGTIGMTGLFAGVTGLPGYSMILGLAEGIRELLRPDMEDEESDEYYDEDDDGNPLGKRSLKLWFSEWFIPTYFGPESDLAKALGLTEEQALTLQRSVKMGPISAMTDLNIGASVSLDGLWFRDDKPAESSKEAFQQFVFGLTGPFGAMGEQIAGAFDEFNNGNFNKGLEKLSPAFIRGLIASNRLATEGLQTTTGAQIRDAEWYTTGKLLAQSLGFQSTEVAEIQKKNFIAKQMVVKIQKERIKVLQDLDKAIQKYENNPTDSNEAGVEDALIAIDRYNYENGMLAISGETVSKSLQGRMERRSEAVEGLSVTPKEAPFVYPMLEKSMVEQ